MLLGRRYHAEAIAIRGPVLLAELPMYFTRRYQTILFQMSGKRIWEISLNMRLRIVCRFVNMDTTFVYARLYLLPLQPPQTPDYVNGSSV